MDALRTVQRALDVIDCFSIEETELSLTEISNKIDLAKSTTTRLLATLEMNGFVTKNPGNLKYRLGHKLYYLGYIAGKMIRIREIAYPFMEDLRNEIRETVNLYLLEDEYRVCIEQCESLQSLRHQVKIGEKLPLWAGAGGKVLLAYQSEKFQQQIFDLINSKEKVEHLQRELKEIREDGYAWSRDEREIGLSAMAAPIFGIDGKVNVCLSVSGPSHRFTPEVMTEFKMKLKHQASVISEHNGYIKEGIANR